MDNNYFPNESIRYDFYNPDNIDLINKYQEYIKSDLSEEEKKKEIKKILISFFEKKEIQYNNIKYIELSYTDNDIENLLKLSEIHKKQGRIKQSIDMLKKASDLGSEKAMLELADYYKISFDYNKMKEMFEKLVKIESKEGYEKINLYCYKHFTKIVDFEEQIEYLASNNNIQSIISLCQYYKKQKNYKKYETYLLKGVSLNNKWCLDLLCEFLYNCKRYDEFEACCKNGMEIDSIKVKYAIYLYKIKKEYDESIQILLNINQDNIIKNILSEINFSTAYKLIEKYNLPFFSMERQFIKNKLKLSKKDSCPICMNDNIDVIPYDCHEHYFCLDCYCNEKDYKCPMCRIPKNEVFAGKKRKIEETQLAPLNNPMFGTIIPFFGNLSSLTNTIHN